MHEFIIDDNIMISYQTNRDVIISLGWISGWNSKTTMNLVA